MAKQEENYTRVPNIILDDTTLNVYEKAILIHIARQTIGYGKKSDGISLSQFVKATGVSKATIIRTISTLKKDRYIKVSKQTAASGGKSYNRYSLTLVSHRHHLVSDRHYPSVTETPPLVSERDIQKKIEQKKIDKRREREHTSKNILFSLSENIRAKEVDRFAESFDGIRNLAAYKVKLKQKIYKEHKQTLEEFESWYLSDKCYALSSKYVGHRVAEYEIENISTYLDMNMKDGGYGHDDWKFVVQAKRDDGLKELRAYSTMEDVELDMFDGFDLGEVIYSKFV